ncbi:Uncharacterised protein [Segatella copri]|nr:Uncharacterised protein [Segatella copri]
MILGTIISVCSESLEVARLIATSVLTTFATCFLVNWLLAFTGCKASEAAPRTNK